VPRPPAGTARVRLWPCPLPTVISVPRAQQSIHRSETRVPGAALAVRGRRARKRGRGQA
jgi:hypothetical protein